MRLVDLSYKINKATNLVKNHKDGAGWISPAMFSDHQRITENLNFQIFGNIITRHSNYYKVKEDIFF